MSPPSRIDATIHDGFRSGISRRWFRVRRTPREGTVELGVGQIVLRAGRARAVIRAKDVTGACTAHEGNDFLLSLSVGPPGTTPVALEVSSSDDVRRIRGALGLGYEGVGEVSWPTNPNAHASILLGMTFLFLAIFGSLSIPDDRTAGVGLAFMFAVYFPVLLFALVRTKRHYLAISARGVEIRRMGYPVYIGYREVTDMNALAHHLNGVLTDAVWHRHACVQIADAVARSHGRVEEKPSFDAAAELQRRVSESDAQWFERLEVVARSVDKSGFRGGGVPGAEVRAAFENPDADFDLRRGAAFVLGHLVRDPGERERLFALAVATPSKEQANALRVALVGEPLAEEIDDDEVAEREEKRRK